MKDLKKIYKFILEKDKENIDLKYSSYPAGIAYIAAILSGEKRTQDQIAKVANCSINSLRKRYKAIVKRTEIDVPE